MGKTESQRGELFWLTSSSPDRERLSFCEIAYGLEDKTLKISTYLWFLGSLESFVPWQLPLLPTVYVFPILILYLCLEFPPTPPKKSETQYLPNS